MDQEEIECILAALLALIVRAGGSVRLPVEEAESMMNNYELVWSGNQSNGEAVISASRRSSPPMKGFEIVELPPPRTKGPTGDW